MGITAVTGRIDFLKRNVVRVAVIVVSLLVISVIHYAASASEMAWHEVFQRAFYLPIVVAGLWYGLRGGLQAAALAAVLFLPHVIARSHGFPSYEFNQVSEALLFFVFGGLAGVLSDQQRRQREQLQKTAQRPPAPPESGFLCLKLGAPWTGSGMSTKSLPRTCAGHQMPYTFRNRYEMPLVLDGCLD
jgi:hypothetical protein